MNEKMVKGAFIVTLGIVLSKGLSLFFIFPFSKMVGTVGLSLYSYAYVPYTIFIDLATMGIPLGISKMISKYNSHNMHRTINKTMKMSFIFMLIIGIVSFLVLNFISELYAKSVLGDSSINTIASIKTVIFLVSLSLLVIPFVSVLRGYFQGHNRMIPGVISQIIEQIIRVSLILVSCYIIMYRLDGEYVKAVNVAVFSAFVAGVGSFIVLVIYYYKTPKELSFESVKYKKLFRELFSYAIPYAIVGLNITIYNLIDSLSFNNGLNNFGIANAEYVYGIYAFEINKLVSIPLSLAIGFSVSILPSVTFLIEKKKDCKKILYLVYKVLNLIIIPIVLLCMLFSYNIYNLFYSSGNIGGEMLFYYAPLIFMLSLNTINNSMMQSLNKGKLLIISLTIGLLFKILSNYYFISNLGYKGAILSTILSLGTTVILNMFFLRKSIDYKEVFEKIFNISWKALVALFPLIIGKIFFRYSGEGIVMNITYLMVNGFIYIVIYGFLIKKDIKQFPY